MNDIFMAQNMVYLGFYYLCLRFLNLSSWYLSQFPIQFYFIITAYISLFLELSFLNTNLILTLLPFSKSSADIPLSTEWNSFSLLGETGSFIIWLQVILRKPHLVLPSFSASFHTFCIPTMLNWFSFPKMLYEVHFLHLYLWLSYSFLLELPFSSLLTFYLTFMPILLTSGICFLQPESTMFLVHFFIHIVQYALTWDAIFM